MKWFDMRTQGDSVGAAGLMAQFNQYVYFNESNFFLTCLQGH